MSVPHLDWDWEPNKNTDLNGSIKGIRIQYWFRRLQQRLGVPVSAHKMGMLYEQPDFIRKTGDRAPSSSGKWKGYESEKYEPKKKTLKAVERQSPGSTRDLHHPLWQVLEIENASVMEGDAFLHQLSPDVRGLMFKTEEDVGIPYMSRAPVNVHMVSKLVCMSNLDSLACLTWLLREAAIKRRGSAEAVALGKSVHFVLTMLALDFHRLNVATRVLTLFVKHVLPLGAPPHHKMFYEAPDFLRHSCELNLIANGIMTRDGSSPKLWRNRVETMLKILKGRRGFFLQAAFGPFFALDETLHDIPLQMLEHHKLECSTREWGRLAIDAGLPPGYFPPNGLRISLSNVVFPAPQKKA